MKPALYGTAHYISHNDYYTQRAAHWGDTGDDRVNGSLCTGSRASQLLYIVASDEAGSLQDTLSTSTNSDFTSEIKKLKNVTLLNTAFFTNLKVLMCAFIFKLLFPPTHPKTRS